MRKLPFIPTLVFLAAHSSTARAVDGVGLFEFFPVLEWLLWFILASIAAIVLKRGYIPRNRESSLARRIGSSALAALLVSPILVGVLSPYYVRAKCAEASLTVIVQPSAWVPSSPIPSAMFTSKLNDQSEVETNTIPGLLDYYGRQGGTLGVWQYNHRLVDQSTGRTLMSASYIGSHRTGPMVCEAAIGYWRLHKEFEKKASTAAR